MNGRAMYIWRLAPVLAAEGGVNRVVEKARRAKLSALWIKVADGPSPSPNVRGSTGQAFSTLIDRCTEKGIEVWGWHVPHVASSEDVGREVAGVREAISHLKLDGLIMDAEGGPEFFHGNVSDADAYGSAMRQLADAIGKPLGISSNDIPQNIGQWFPKFNAIAGHAQFNAPQVYYGGSPSVLNRLSRAENANRHLTIPFVPVGAAWIGNGGGCESASACAERAREFIRLVHARQYVGYSFWHWFGAPAALWEVLNTVAV